MHHASIYVESKAGEGSCFSINFKRVENILVRMLILFWTMMCNLIILRK